ncbi:MAG: methyltransferase FkbM family [Ilumatobacteraceae bacterium]|nr:methyltransferase FkbM family [Ilumatobacteraceae bacterium]
MNDETVTEPTVPARGRVTSFSQNSEDIVLARGLPGDVGFYVDIGAYDPDVESVTKLFYERGWRGINVDPVATFIDRFDAERPRDINICAAICEDDGDQSIWISPPDVPGHSTLDADIAASHVVDGQIFSSKTVRSIRLDTLLDTYLPAGQTIDFLKVDVEGAERAVLASWDPSRHRPRVIVVEALAPHVDGSTHAQWEHFLLEAGYVFTLFDGLNRFYVRDEPELVERLSTPANIMDGFERSTHLETQRFLDALADELTYWKRVAAAQSDRITWLEAKVAGGRDSA